MTPYAGGVHLVDVLRSGFVEGHHHGSAVVLDADGTVVASAGDRHNPMFPRSTNKLMQAAAMLAAGLPLSDPADLALVAASHNGEEFHVDRVRAMLRAGGLSEDDLRCPAAFPFHEPAHASVLRAGGGPLPVFMNCSGKHTGMLLTCAAMGWSRSDYLSPDHPLQKACTAAISEFADETVEAVAVDGCQAPAAALSLTGLARAYLRAVSAAPGTPERTVADAMRAHPELVAGTDRDDTLLMRAVPGLLSKVGAEGVIAAALPGVGAVAIKVDDGAGRPRIPLLAAALTHLNLSLALPPFPTHAEHELRVMVDAIRRP